MKHNFETMATPPKTAQLLYFKQPLPKTGPFRFATARFQTPQEWARHAKNVIRAYNLDYSSFEKTDTGYEIVFTDEKHYVIFDFAATGERIANFTCKAPLKDPSLGPYLGNAGEMHCLEKGLTVEIAEEDDQVAFTFDRKSSYTSFVLAYDKIYDMALQQYSMAMMRRPEPRSLPAPLPRVPGAEIN